MPKRDLMRDEIVKSARVIFSKFGYRKATMDDIAEGVSKGKSSIYYYFSSKEDIFKEVVLTEAKMFRLSTIHDIDKTNDPREKLKEYVKNRLKTSGKFVNLHNALTDETLQKMKYIHRINKLYDKEEFRLFRNILTEGINAGYFKINDVDLASIAMVTAMKGIETILFSKRDTIDVENKLSDIINIIFYGIIKR